MMTARIKAAAAITLAVGLYGCGSVGTDTGEANVLTAAKTSTPPKLDGSADDAAWTRAKPLRVKLTDGANFADGKGETTATLRAVYTDDTLYMLVQYADPTESYRRSPYQKQPDGSWKKLADANDKGGDNNVYYEDKWAMLWSVGNSIKDFDKRGCAVTCHVGEGKPFGNKYTRAEGEIGDIWHMKGVRTAPVGQVDDQYLDHTRYDAQKSPEAGRKSDPRTGGGYADVKLVNGKPEFMDKAGLAANKGGKYWVVDSDKSAFDDGKFVVGDEVASISIAPFAGDRGDISVVTRYSNGMWTSEVSRKLATGSKFDVQFSDLSATYYFGLAAFDNAQVRHAVHFDALQLRFAR